MVRNLCQTIINIIYNQYTFQHLKLIRVSDVPYNILNPVLVMKLI